MFNIAVVGCGNMSEAWIKFANSNEDCEIKALVDVNLDMANAKKEKHALDAKVFADIETALEKENIDIVFNVTPPAFHYHTVSTALMAGSHVFGEKPMSDNIDEAYKIIELSDKTKKEYFVMQNRRYIPQIYGFRDFLQSNELGTVGQLSANFQLGPHFGGFRDEMDNPLILDMAIHTFDAARFLLNKNAVSVYCKEFNPSWSWYKGNANAVCIFEMDDGSVFDYRGSWCATGLKTSWESEWWASCTRGSAYWDGFDKLHYNTVKEGSRHDVIQKDIPPVDIAFGTEHNGCINEMLSSLKNGTRPQTDCRDNIKSIKMVYKAIESARTGKVIAI